ncbi:MAG TPA: aminopeptidase P family protein [Alphaproteobacteria bacterium]
MTQALLRLREKMRNEQIDILLLPHNDRFQSEYLPAHEERFPWLNGFTGSWGFAIITAEKAILFVDGRYTLQAPRQVDGNFWTIIQVLDQRPQQWLSENLQPDQIVALEGWRFTVQGVQGWQKIITAKKAQLQQREDDIFTGLWLDRPALPAGEAFALDLTFAGRSTDDKVTDLQDFMTKNHLDGYLVTDPGHVCWLLNMRGHDITHMPIILSMAFVAADGQISLFTDAGKIPDNLRALWGSRVTHHLFDEMVTTLIDHSAQKIGLDGSHCPSVLASLLKQSGKELHEHASPLELARAIKNVTEINGAHQAQLRDGIAVMETLYWLQSHESPTGLTEQDVIDYLDAQRAAQELFVETSFGAIVGSGPHGAFVHYDITPGDDIGLKNDTLLLIDGGGQYYDGTTDITRTISIGTPTPRMIADYTAVLQGHIALSVARFPHGTTGAALDTLARAPLWQVGRNYTHGTGHGIGAFMGTHEGPQGFSYRSPVALQAGMLITNEPGYYKTDGYGIRLENVVLVKDVTVDDDDQPMLGFEALTVVPFESHLINFGSLNATEKNWLRDYHQMVLDKTLPLLRPELQLWLQEKCKAFLVQ